MRVVFLRSAYALTAVVLLNTAVFAQDIETNWSCQVGSIERNIMLIEGMSEGSVCEVWYDKTQEGQTKVRLWNARNDVNYCRPHAEQLVEKLSASGWACVMSDTAAMIEE